MLLDQTVALLREGYRFLPNRRERYGSDVYETRVLGRRAICLVEAEAARLLYDESRFQRAGAMPGAVRATLVGNGGVQPPGPGGRRSAAGPTATGWCCSTKRPRVLVRAACDWLGVPLRACGRTSPERWR